MYYAAIGKPHRSIFAQNWSERFVVWVKHRRLSTAVPDSFHFMPEPQSRCLTITLQAASVMPLPIGSLFATVAAYSIRPAFDWFPKYVIARCTSSSSLAHGRTVDNDLNCFKIAAAPPGCAVVHPRGRRN